MSKDVAEDMRWHKEKRVNDDVIRHPADATAWQEFDKENDWFALDPRNIRLGLASDGFNPFGNMSNSYSMWPVIILPYNLPPWKYELKDSWENGVETYDAYSNEKFRQNATLLWTINDFPAYNMLSGWSTKGKLACLVCNKWTHSITLKNGQKQCYMGHRRYLNKTHPWRKSKKFDGKPEYREKPPVLSGNDVEHVFYIDDVKNGDNWKIVQKTNHRHIFNVPEVEGNESDLASNDDPYRQFEPVSNDVHQINIESNESLNQETEVEEIDSSFLSSKSRSMSNERTIHTDLFDGDDEDDYDDDTILKYLDDNGENEDIDEEKDDDDDDEL
ncbi:hypothetical protein GQ457_07G009520 [Hibiscus cannabinus]